MGAKATTVDEQIALLKGRGMVIADEPKAKEILLDIGYYRLGFYWNCFECDDKHTLTAGTKFEDVVSLYYLDVDLRELLLKYIYRIEVHFRTQIVYYVSNKYQDSPTWFVNSKVVGADYITSFEKFYDENFKKNNKPILKHHQKYINDKFAPAWKTIEFIPFGGSLKLFKAIKDESIKQTICSSYNLKKLYIFQNFMQTLIYVRNMCSHGGVLYDLMQPKGISNIPGNKYNFRNQHSLDASIKVIRYLLAQISTNREIEMELKLDTLFKSFENNPMIKKVINEKIDYAL
ncbi:Abi family protein [Pedobacter jejuensis]|uniref:Abi family protein n=1 Tax=Pedobacter jejuensis TaxID=1268550 RepID=A0A3N0BN64_9SPHI|nr:Abi family protein [Pedobacter jejuensis]RNL50109.1 Abi family protein [Pedobacter jejuensis]